MAEEENKEEAAPETVPETGSKKKKMIIIIAAAVLILGGVAAFFLMGGKKKTAEQEAGKEETHGEANEKEEAHGKEKGKEGEKPNGEDKGKEGEHKKTEEGHGGGEKKAEGHGKAEQGEKKEVPAAEENLIDFGSSYNFKPFHLNLGNPLENRYIRIDLAVEFKGGAAQQKEIEARLPQLRDAVISTVSKKTREFLLTPDGKDQLRLEILNSINQYMDKKIDSIFFTDFIIE